MAEPVHSLSSRAEPRKGRYLGTEVGGKWWRRQGRGWLARGSGHWWLDPQGLHFLRYFTKKNLFIPYWAMTKVHLGNWHAGQWQAWQCAVKIDWHQDGREFSSGFVFSNRHADNLRAAARLRALIKTARAS